MNLSLGLSASSRGGMFLPSGFIFLVDQDGAFLLDANGAFLMEKI